MTALIRVSMSVAELVVIVGVAVVVGLVVGLAIGFFHRTDGGGHDGE